jgi:hypothetical protein
MAPLPARQKISALGLLLLLSFSLIPSLAYSQTYDEWFAVGWNAGCVDGTNELAKRTEGKNTPFVKGYEVGYIECSSGNTSNSTLIRNQTNVAYNETITFNAQNNDLREQGYSDGCADSLNGLISSSLSNQSDTYRLGYKEGYDACPAETTQSNLEETNTSSNSYDIGHDFGCDDVGRSESTKFGNEKQLQRHSDNFVQGYYVFLQQKVALNPTKTHRRILIKMEALLNLPLPKAEVLTGSLYVMTYKQPWYHHATF